MSENAMRRAIDVVGGTTRMSQLLGISKQRVSNWAARGVPVEWCPQIEAVTDGGVRCEELRPDVRWSVLRQAA